MRLQMAAQPSGAAPPSPTTVTFTDDGTFNVATYLGLGYTNFEVVCVGAAGGHGGGINPVGDWQGAAYSFRAYGGAPGGGGTHLVSGALSSLPSSVSVVVGVPGGDEPNVYVPDDGPLLTGGGDGGYSSFHGSVCKASGGKGGFPAYYDAFANTSWGGDGGRGGVGNDTVAGGGGYGGIAEGDYSGSSPGGAGTWDGAIGGGGGGGGGGTAWWDNYAIKYYPTDGGYGNYGGSYLYAAAGGASDIGLNNDPFEEWRQDTGSYVYDIVIPGAGGGSYLGPFGAGTYGARTLGASPYGVVKVKLT